MVLIGFCKKKTVFEAFKLDFHMVFTMGWMWEVPFQYMARKPNFTNYHYSSMNQWNASATTLPPTSLSSLV